MLAGNVEHPVVLHLIRDARLLLRTTLFDGDAISVREALFLGTPVIATDNKMRPDGRNTHPIRRQTSARPPDSLDDRHRETTGPRHAAGQFEFE